MNELTDEQKAIVNPDIWSSAIVVAKAGSGKTTTIINRAIHQAETLDDWRDIAIISFTNKSVEDIRRRLKFSNANNIISLTFHSFLIQHIFSFRPLFRNNKIYFNFAQRVNDFKEWGEYILCHKEIPVSVDPKNDYLLECALHIIYKYHYIRKYLQYKFVAIYIDEAQDNNQLQYDIVRVLVDLGIQVVLIGDENQTIYQFRGASADKFLAMKEHPAFKNNIYKLTRNFRCHHLIDSCANDYSIPKEDNCDDKGNGIFIRQIDQIGNEIDHLTENGGVCFLFRGINGTSNQKNRDIISKYSIPIISIPDIVSKSNNPEPLNLLFRMFFGDYKDDLEFIESIIPNIPNSIAEKIVKNFKNNPNKKTLTELNNYALVYEQNKLDEIINALNDNNVRNFYTLDFTKVFGMTIHSSKGLEFRNVVVISSDFNDLHYNNDTKKLFYVACTRAKEKLIFIK